MVLLSRSLGGHCCIWYDELQIVLLYHLNVTSAIHWEQLGSWMLPGKRRGRMFFASLGKKILFGWQIFFPCCEDCCCFPNSFSLLCFCPNVAFPSFCGRTWEKVNHNVTDLWSFLTSGMILFNIVVGKSAVTCQKIKQPIFHHKLNKHWKISILQGPLAYISL